MSLRLLCLFVSAVSGLPTIPPARLPARLPAGLYACSRLQLILALSRRSLTCTDMADFINKTTTAFHSLRPLPTLWSPAITRGRASYTPTSFEAFQANLVSLFSALDLPIKLHFQDFLGQSVTFKFPFFYNYSVALTCDGDTVPYYNMLQTVALQAPKLEEVKVTIDSHIPNCMHT